MSYKMKYINQQNRYAGTSNLALSVQIYYEYVVGSRAEMHRDLVFETKSVSDFLYSRPQIRTQKDFVFSGKPTILFGRLRKGNG